VRPFNPGKGRCGCFACSSMVSMSARSPGNAPSKAQYELDGAGRWAWGRNDASSDNSWKTRVHGLKRVGGARANCPEACPCSQKENCRSRRRGQLSAVLTSVIERNSSRTAGAGAVAMPCFHVGNNLRPLRPRGGLRPAARSAVPTTRFDGGVLTELRNARPCGSFLLHGEVGKLMPFERQKF